MKKPSFHKQVNPSDGFQVVDGSNPADSKNSNGTATRSKVYEHFLLNEESKYGCIHCRLDVKITSNFGIKSQVVCKKFN